MYKQGKCSCKTGKSALRVDRLHGNTPWAAGGRKRGSGQASRAVGNGARFFFIYTPCTLCKSKAKCYLHKLFSFSMRFYWNKSEFKNQGMYYNFYSLRFLSAFK